MMKDVQKIVPKKPGCLKLKINYFTPIEKGLWCCSAALIILAFIMFDGTGYLSLCASLIGVTSLIFNAKGNPIGQLLMVIFSVIYGIISFGFAYYGEMLTYLGMTAPMALFSLITWLRHPFAGANSQVEINSISLAETAGMLLLTGVVTWIFYWILRYFHTANLVLSTISVTTSFIAVYLTFRRSSAFALAYAANDIVLIALWILAAFENRSYISVVVCFAAFLVNDLYGYINWKKMRIRQKQYVQTFAGGNMESCSTGEHA